MQTEYKGNRTVNGIWLMNEDALNSLEKMAWDVFNYLSEVQAKMKDTISDKSTDKYEYEYLIKYTKEPKISVYFSDKTKIDGSSFKELFDVLDVRQKVPKEIVISMCCLDINVNLTLSSGDSSNFFRYDVVERSTEPKYTESKNIVIGKIENWIDENKPDLLLKVWYSLAQWTPICVLLWLLLIAVSVAVYSTTKNSYFDFYETEIAEIVNTGITDDNRDRVIELILLKQYDYVPEEWMQQNSKVDDRIIYVSLLGILACIFISICPKSNFAIGKGKKKVKFWNSYRKIVFVLIPTSFIIPVLLDKIF